VSGSRDCLADTPAAGVAGALPPFCELPRDIYATKANRSNFALTRIDPFYGGGTGGDADGRRRRQALLVHQPDADLMAGIGLLDCLCLKNILGGVELALRGISPPFFFASPILSRPRPALIADQMDIFLKIGSGISLMIVMTGHQIHLV
jgi:hypothetical protein